MRLCHFRNDLINVWARSETQSWPIAEAMRPSALSLISHAPDCPFFTGLTHVGSEHWLHSLRGATCGGYTDEWDRLGSASMGPTIKGHQIKCLGNEWMNQSIKSMTSQSHYSFLDRVPWGVASDISLACVNLLLVTRQSTPWEQRPFYSHMLYRSRGYLPKFLTCREKRALFKCEWVWFHQTN